MGDLTLSEEWVGGRSEEWEEEREEEIWLVCKTNKKKQINKSCSSKSWDGAVV